MLFVWKVPKRGLLLLKKMLSSFPSFFSRQFFSSIYWLFLPFFQWGVKSWIGDKLGEGINVKCEGWWGRSWKGACGEGSGLKFGGWGDRGGLGCSFVRVLVLQNGAKECKHFRLSKNSKFLCILTKNKDSIEIKNGLKSVIMDFWIIKIID